jgi:hypothetical protein
VAECPYRASGRFYFATQIVYADYYYTLIEQSKIRYGLEKVLDVKKNCILRRLRHATAAEGDVAAG